MGGQLDGWSFIEIQVSGWTVGWTGMEMFNSQANIQDYLQTAVVHNINSWMVCRSGSFAIFAFGVLMVSA